MKNKIKIIGFDADDTLWVNELNYKATEAEFCKLLSGFLPEEEVSKVLYEVEVENMELYGYGAKAFILSVIETALKISNSKLDSSIINEIIKLGKNQINKPIILLDGVTKVLEYLYPKYKLIVVTKGDLLDQERKLNNSNLVKYFHHIEIMSDKKPEQYYALLKHLDIKPNEFLMIGNSIKSDILPVLDIGGYAIHVPYHTNWQFENTDTKINSDKFFKVSVIEEVIGILK
ncbi:MAG: HAD family hydrolase, partial [Chlorobi bacterium]|nr:HAD family hydrolase [Chlorobiota bacterium]